MLTVGLILIVGNILARAAAVPRLVVWSFRRSPLPFFSLFLLAALGQALVMQSAWWIFHRIDIYKSVQQGMFLPMTVLQIASILEGFWWLATCLPRFRKIAAVLMLICAGASFLVARTNVNTIAAIEQGLGFGLATFVCLTLAIHRVIGTDCRAALWHAGCLGAISFFNGIVWALQGDRLLMTLSYSLQVGASVVWLLTVRTPPVWKEPEPVGTEAELREAIKNLRVD